MGIQIDVWPRTKTRRDLDNIAKLILDALNKHAWADDHQVDLLRVERHWTLDVGDGEVEGAYVRCWPMQDDDVVLCAPAVVQNGTGDGAKDR